MEIYLEAKGRIAIWTKEMMFKEHNEGCSWRGQYVVLGKARWNNSKHGAFVKRVCKVENLDYAIETYVKNEISEASVL